MRSVHPLPDPSPLALGARLRSARQAQSLTLSQVAAGANLSKGFLSRLERDETSPSVATLLQLCQVLSLPVGALFAEPDAQHIHLRDAPRVNFGGQGADERMLTPRNESRVQIVRSELSVGAHGGNELYTISCELEVVHVVVGSLVMHLTDRLVTLEAGDSLTLSGREPHTWRVDGDEPTVVLWTLVPAAWSGSA